MIFRQRIKRIFPPSAWVPAAAALLGCLLATSAMAGESAFPVLQVLVVTTPDWSAPEATLQAYERKDGSAPWIPLGVRIPAVTGRTGLAWGRGLHQDLQAPGPQKREGDGKAPAGVFRLGPAFGYAPAESLPWIGLPYRQMGEASRCVDDTASAFYNRLVEEGSVRKDWNSFEEMRRSDGQYRLGIVIDHNADPVAPGCGSCIFLHIWKSAAGGTAGCTAVSDADMETILRALKPEAHPLVVQLPRWEYEQLRGSWGLP